MAGEQQGQGQQGGAMTPEEITQLVNTTLNSALTARSKQWKKEIADEMGKGFELVSKRLDDLAATKTDKRKTKDGEEDEGSVQYKGLQRQMADLKAQLEERDRALAAASEKQKQGEARSHVSELLGKLGGITNPTQIKAALAVLKEENKIRFDEDGSLVFYESADSALDIETGLKSWLKTDDAKIFLPPTGAHGSGARPPAQRTRNEAPRAKTETEEAYELGMALIANQGVPVPIG